MTTMHAAAAFPHPLGLAPDRPENLLQLLYRLRNEAGDTIRLLRKEAEDSVSLLIDFLDATDGDADLEDGGDDEPSLGMFEAVARGQQVFAADDANDLEVGEGDDEDDGTAEPSLGASEPHLDLPLFQMAGHGPLVGSCRPLGTQLDWGHAGTRRDDAEEDVQDQPHDAGFEGNDEPSLGALNEPSELVVVERQWEDGPIVRSFVREGDQSRWASSGGVNDAEDEHDGSEPDDEDAAVDDGPCDDDERDSCHSATRGAPFWHGLGLAE